MLATSPIWFVPWLGLALADTITGGAKFKAVVKFDTNVPYGENGYGVMFVNPSVETVRRFLDGTLRFDINDLGRCPPSPAEAPRMNDARKVDAILVAALQDVFKTYEKEASGFFARSSTESRRVVGGIKGRPRRESDTGRQAPRDARRRRQEGRGGSEQL